MTLKTSGLPTRRLPSAALRVVARPVPVDDHDRLVAHDPGVVAARERSDVARTGNELGAVVHPDPQPAAGARPPPPPPPISRISARPFGNSRVSSGCSKCLCSVSCLGVIAVLPSLTTGQLQ